MQTDRQTITQMRGDNWTALGQLQLFACLLKLEALFASFLTSWTSVGLTQTVTDCYRCNSVHQ